jgi:hypothetical protein
MLAGKALLLGGVLLAVSGCDADDGKTGHDQVDMASYEKPCGVGAPCTPPYECVTVEAGLQPKGGQEFFDVCLIPCTASEVCPWGCGCKGDHYDTDWGPYWYCICV